MRTVRALIAYDGSPYYGWQRQDGFDSVQQRIEEALEMLVGDAIVVHGAGRTDTGVHALGQVAHFHLDGKRYAYRVVTERFRPPFGRGGAHWVPDPLDAAAMRAAGRELLGTHDFRAFASAGSPRKSTVRTLSHLRLVARRSGFWLVVQGDGFLYNMVRAIAGTLLEVGRGKLTPAAVGEILASRDRRRAGPTAPAEGLYLLSVLYGEPIFPGRDRGTRGTPGLFQY
jgi:tRNA pseudouridine38-40 synthase